MHPSYKPTAARRAFPCWDEPSLKARFTITMISRKDTTSLSNMSVASEEVYKPETSNYDDAAPAKILASLGTEEQSKDEWKITKFNTTPLVR
jgi:aminopeptidase 2